MQLRTRVKLGSLFATSAVLAAVLAWHAQRQSTPKLVVAPMPIAQAAPAPQVTEPESVATERSEEAPEPDTLPRASVGDVPLEWLPKGYLQDVTGEQTAELASLVQGWAASNSDEPRIEYRKGVVFARSTEDRGDDGPYPRSAAPQDMRVCGEASVWLRSALRERLANDEITCAKNVCMVGGMEYAPDSYLVFRPVTYNDEPAWRLDAWIEVYRAALDEQTAERDQGEVVRALRHQLSTSCAGEPAGYY
jgi:hypothetical protein